MTKKTRNFVVVSGAILTIGLGTGLARVRRLGWKSFCVGLAAAVVVGGVSAALIVTLGAVV